MIELRFTTTKKSFVSSAIRLLTWSPWSHVEFLIPGEGYLGARMKGGVLLRSFDYDPKCQFQMANVVLPSKEIEDRVLDFAKDQIGKPYDLRGVFGIAVHRDWHKADSWFCSELVAAAFENAGFPLVSPVEHLDRVTPGDIWYSPRVFGQQCCAAHGERR